MDEESFINLLGVDYKRESGLFKICCPFHHDTHPSLVVYPQDRGYCCFRKGTMVITKNGVREISSLVGEKVSVINGLGEWEEVSFKSYGVAPLMKVTATRNRIEKVIYATPNHEWFTDDGVKATSGLKPGDRLEKKTLAKSFSPSSFDARAFSHGVVFGDGAEIKEKRYKDGRKVYGVDVWCPEKECLLKFCDHVWKGERYSRGYWRGVSEDWKNPFDIGTKDDEYLFWFLAGYFATDGHTVGSRTSISSAKEENLVLVKNICNRLGFFAYSIVSQTRLGLGKQPTKLYRLRFGGLPNLFYYRHEQTPEARKFCNYLGWKIKAVEQTNIEEEVFCCTTSTESFVLDDNILTHNCYPCGRTGSWVELYKEMKDCDWQEAYNVLEIEGDYRDKSKPAPLRFDFVDPESEEIISAVNERYEKCFDLDCPEARPAVEFLKKKHLLELAKELGWRWDKGEFIQSRPNGALVIPYREEGGSNASVGAGRIVACRLRTLEADGLSKPKTLKGTKAQPFILTRPDKKELYICEGESDALSLYASGCSVVAVPGATQKKCINTAVLYAELLDVEKIVSCGDNDGPGQKMNELVARAAHALTTVEVTTLKPEALGGMNDINDAYVAGKLSLAPTIEDIFPGAVELKGWESVMAKAAFSNREEIFDLITDELENIPDDTPQPEMDFVVDLVSGNSLEGVRDAWVKGDMVLQRKYVYLKEALKLAFQPPVVKEVKQQTLFDVRNDN